MNNLRITYESPMFDKGEKGFFDNLVEKILK